MILDKPLHVDASAEALIYAYPSCHFNPGKSAYYAAEAWLSLGSADNARRAVADAEEATVLLTAEAMPSAELVTAARLDLSAAQLAMDDLSVQGDRTRIGDLERLFATARHGTAPVGVAVPVSREPRQRYASSTVLIAPGAPITLCADRARARIELRSRQKRRMPPN